MSNNQINLGKFSHQGQVRELNEDSIGSPGLYQIPWELQAQRGVLVCVADGMGGHAAGEVASKMAVDALFKIFYASSERDPKRALQISYAAANQEVYELAQKDETKAKMGTTMVAGLLKGKDLYLANVGDSRAYLIHNGKIQQLSRDHSLVAEQIRMGFITEEQARSSLQRNVITRAIGIEPEVKVDIISHRLKSNDALVLCSDGLSNELTDADILRVVMENFKPQDAVEKMIALANERGARDNVSAIVVRMPL